MQRLRPETTRKIGGSNSGITPRRTPIEIPHALMAEILARLPVKSLARLLCVSKLWASTIRSRDFMESFMTQSSTRPCLLFNFMDVDYKSNFFYSSPHPRNRDDESSSLAIREATLPGYLRVTMVHSVRGLICFGPDLGFMVCNPSTGGFVILPEIESKLNWESGYGFFGYDPIEKQYKVLWVMRAEYFTVDDRRSLDYEIQVFTLGDREWRRIDGVALHFPCSNGVCINGVVYYRGNRSGSMDYTIVSFDVRSEKFRFIKLPHFYGNSNLMNFEGRLALAYADETGTAIVSLVLEDPEKGEWSKKIYDLPGSLRDLVGDTVSRFCLSATAAGEIILAPHLLCKPFYLLYYNPRRNSLRRVEIEGVGHHGFTLKNGQPVISRHVYTFSDHVESTMFL